MILECSESAAGRWKVWAGGRMNSGRDSGRESRAQPGCGPSAVPVPVGVAVHRRLLNRQKGGCASCSCRGFAR